MKKSLITLLALAGAATATEPTLLWDMDFTNDGIKVNSTNAELTLGELPDNVTIDGTSGTMSFEMKKYSFTQSEGQLTLDDEFTFIVQLSANTMADKTYPVYFSLGMNNDNCFKAGYYTLDPTATGDQRMDDRFVLDIDWITDGNTPTGTFDHSNRANGNITYDFETSPLVTLALYNDGNGKMTYYVDGSSAGYITYTLNEGVDSTIDSFSLGGRIDNANNNSDIVIHNVQMVSGYTSTVLPTIPEPTTATLSLLALCSLAARRRRK